MRKTLLTLFLAGAVSASAQAQPAPTDPQIAHILVTANQVDIDAGKLAEKSGSTADPHCTEVRIDWLGGLQICLDSLIKSNDRRNYS